MIIGDHSIIEVLRSCCKSSCWPKHKADFSI